MNYGMVSDAMMQSEVTVMRGRRILNDNIYPVCNCEVLVSRLGHGDTVTIASIIMFESISQFVLFARAVVKAGANLKILEQPYLEVGNGRYWRDAIVRDINYRITLEKEMLNVLLQKIHMDNSARLSIARHLAKFDLAVMAKNYSMDGILRRG